MKKKQILFIVWKWNHLTPINEHSFKEVSASEFLQDIRKGEGKFFQTYPVASESLGKSEDLVVAVNIYKDQHRNRTIPLLDAVIKQYKSENSEAIVLLHQAHRYQGADVEHCLKQQQVRNCFLFAGEHDYIYYNAQHGGLLDGEGKFFIGRNPYTKEPIKIPVKDESSGKELINRHYFNRTWSHYIQEQQHKVLQLKEDFFDAIFPLHQKTDGPVLTKKELLKALDLMSDRCLFLRIKSFIGGYKTLESMDIEKLFEEYDQLKAEKDQIKSLERVDRISYDFDDCIPYFEDAKQQLIKDSYLRCKRTFQNLLNTESGPEIDKYDLQELANELSFMVKIIPGEIN
jgi:hypothetical protein